MSQIELGENEYVDLPKGWSIERIGLAWPKPIPASERLPPDREQVMAYFPENDDWHFGMWDVAQVVDGKWYGWPSTGQSHTDITHWLPMPPKPE